MPSIVSIVFRPANVEPKPADHFSRLPLQQASLHVGQGITGDVKGKSDNRQLNIMLAEIVAQLQQEGFQTGPGELGEQIVIAGLDSKSLTIGVRLQLGATAMIELLKPRTGCERFEQIQGRAKEIVQGRLGYMARVVHAGEVAVGDEVSVMTAPHKS
jgi:MOSC domain-containing protein YiiM